MENVSAGHFPLCDVAAAYSSLSSPRAYHFFLQLVSLILKVPFSIVKSAPSPARVPPFKTHPGPAAHIIKGRYASRVSCHELQVE